MQAEARRLDVIANNLANASTPGYKRDTAVQSDFLPVLMERVADRDGLTGRLAPPAPIGGMGLGTRLLRTATRLTDGTLRHTGGALDVALTGDGFFAVRTPQGVRYTRDGAFMQDAGGRLVTSAGHEVLVDGRPVGAPGSRIAIAEDGTVTVDGVSAGRLTVVTSRTAGTLRKAGANLWAADGAGAELPAPAAGAADPRAPYQLRVGFLESANLDPVHEMVEMIAAMRAYEANQRAVHAQDDTLQKAVNEVGRA